MSYIVQFTIKETGNIHNRYFSKRKDALEFKSWVESISDFIDVVLIESE